MKAYLRAQVLRIKSRRSRPNRKLKKKRDLNLGELGQKKTSSLQKIRTVITRIKEGRERRLIKLTQSMTS